MTSYYAPPRSPCLFRRPQTGTADGKRAGGGSLSSRVYLPACSIAACRRRPRRDRLVQPLGWLRLRRPRPDLRVVVVGPLILGSSASSSSPSGCDRPNGDRCSPADTARTLSSDGLQRRPGRSPGHCSHPLLFLRSLERALPWIVLPKIRTGAALGGDRRDLRRHGRHELVRPPGEPPRSACSGASMSFTIRKRT